MRHEYVEVEGEGRYLVFKRGRKTYGLVHVNEGRLSNEMDIYKIKPGNSKKQPNLWVKAFDDELPLLYQRTEPFIGAVG